MWLEGMHHRCDAHVMDKLQLWLCPVQVRHSISHTPAELIQVFLCTPIQSSILSNTSITISECLSVRFSIGSCAGGSSSDMSASAHGWQTSSSSTRGACNVHDQQDVGKSGLNIGITRRQYRGSRPLESPRSAFVAVALPARRWIIDTHPASTARHAPRRRYPTPSRSA